MRCPARSDRKTGEPGDSRTRVMAQRFVMAIDQGTTSTRCIVFDSNARLVSVAQREHRQYYPQPGWVEQDAVEIWRNVDRIMPQALRDAGIAADQVVALGIT